MMSLISGNKGISINLHILKGGGSTLYVTVRLLESAMISHGFSFIPTNIINASMHE